MNDPTKFILNSLAADPNISTHFREAVTRLLTEKKIITDYDPKPSPFRDYDWCAYRDGYEGPDSDGVPGDPIGWGRTEQEAIDELHERESER